jgi:pyruvate dehydrogenase E2 component (dihydrolipoamide acetyltransferase)
MSNDSTSQLQQHCAQFGTVTATALSKIQKVVAQRMHQSWSSIPHVTHNDEAVIDTLNQARQALATQLGKKVTPLPYLVKAAVHTLKTHPVFNSAFDSDSGTLIFKQYYNIGIAVNTPNGLMVPVIANADQKSIPAIADEIAEDAENARTKGLPMSKMVGGCFTISSLGSIGGTSFTPIINAPEVAIMGICKAAEKPTRVNGEMTWQTVLPLSLSYDHRVINGADAAAFCRTFANALANPHMLEQEL